MRDPNAFFMARRFTMRDKDILYVSNAPLSDLQKVFGLINLLVSPVISGAYVDTVVK
jgi:polysaccharide export outer membrane protein